MCPQSGNAAEKSPNKPCDVEVYEKKIKLLEKQRKDASLFLWLRPVLLFDSIFNVFSICSFVLRHVSAQVLEVNKQWDIQWNSMKSQFEQKVQ